MRAFRMMSSLPMDHTLIKQKSNWITNNTLCCLIRPIACNLRELMASNEVVLLLDWRPTNTTPDVLLAAPGARMHLVLISARLTWLLQPLCEYIFCLLQTMCVIEKASVVSEQSRLYAVYRAVDNCIVRHLPGSVGWNLLVAILLPVWVRR